jgi:hypothetical protein
MIVGALRVAIDELAHGKPTIRKVQEPKVEQQRTQIICRMAE